MYSQLFIVEPSSGCPFRVEAIRFVPAQSHDDGLTLFFFHAVNLHKETFTILISQLLENVSSLLIKDIWSIDNPNHGRSAVLNRDLLESEEYREKWSATEYARAAYAFLSATSHGIDFSRRKLVGIAHSGGGTGLLLLQKIQPRIAFQGLVLMDPGVLPPGRPASAKLAKLFNKMALVKRDTWPSIEEARTELSQNGAFRNFHPVTFELFMKYGLRSANASGGVTLACSKLQEGAYYAADDMIVPPAEILLSLSAEDKLPVHLIVCMKDEYKGMSHDMKSFQVDTVGKMSCGSVQIVDKGGHMFPQVEPALTAIHLRSALMKIEKCGARL